MAEGQSLDGVYRLIGVHDMACAFQFSKEGKFNFFMSYGAIDRTATGKYTLHNGLIQLQSDKIPGHDVEILHQNNSSHDIEIKVNAPNEYLMKYTSAIAFYKDQGEKYETNQNGIIKISKPDPDSVFIKHELYADIPTKIRDHLNRNTHFEITLKPSLEQVSFEGIELTMNGDELRMPMNYFLAFNNLRFVRE